MRRIANNGAIRRRGHHLNLAKASKVYYSSPWSLELAKHTARLGVLAVLMARGYFHLGKTYHTNNKQQALNNRYDEQNNEHTRLLFCHRPQPKPGALSPWRPRQMRGGPAAVAWRMDATGRVSRGIPKMATVSFGSSFQAPKRRHPRKEMDPGRIAATSLAGLATSHRMKVPFSHLGPTPIWLRAARPRRPFCRPSSTNQVAPNCKHGHLRARAPPSPLWLIACSLVP